jgi:Endonuclease/Exonuclease/phosphatase family
LFDTLDTENVNDFEFTPKGKNHYTPEVYQTKLDNLSKVISELGTEMTPDGIALLGVSEIENKSVLEDLVIQPAIKHRNYQIVHYDSPDKRGVDVGFLYNPKYFKVDISESIRIENLFRPDGDTVFTRDILLVSGRLDGDPVHIFVNHWPSRSGGESRSAPLRNAAAMALRKKADSLEAHNPECKIIVLGDLNDDPNNDSVKKYLRAQSDKDKVKEGEMFNPMYKFFKKGFGTTAWQDAWSLFDQVIISKDLIKDDDGYFFHEARVFNKPYLTQKSGRFKGYPFRGYVGDNFTGGYSDHFPVFIYLIKRV